MIRKTFLIFLCMVCRTFSAEPADIAFKSALDGTEQRYVELMPDGFEVAKTHDVVIALHGHGSDR